MQSSDPKRLNPKHFSIAVQRKNYSGAIVLGWGISIIRGVVVNGGIIQGHLCGGQKRAIVLRGISRGVMDNCADGSCPGEFILG